MDDIMREMFNVAIVKYENYKSDKAQLSNELEIKVPSIITEAKPPKEDRGSKFSKTVS